jgi:UrcA family protein
MFKSLRFAVRLVALAVLPVLFIAESAIASAATEGPQSVTVRYHDLNLNTAEGIASLYRRLRNAASEVCRPSDLRELARLAYRNDCFDHSVADAVRNVHNEALSAYHWQQIRGWKHPEIAPPTQVAAR